MDIYVVFVCQLYHKPVFVCQLYHKPLQIEAYIAMQYILQYMSMEMRLDTRRHALVVLYLH
jgi:hypothetical protein